MVERLVEVVSASWVYAELIVFVDSKLESTYS